MGKTNTLVEFAYNTFNVLFYDDGEVFTPIDDIKTYIQLPYNTYYQQHWSKLWTTTSVTDGVLQGLNIRTH